MRPLVEPNTAIAIEPAGDRIGIIRSEYKEPVPEGTIVAFMFRVKGYLRDCDGSALPVLEAVDRYGRDTGWIEDAVGLYEDSVIVLDDPDELHRLAAQR